MIDDSKKVFMECASGLGDYQLLTVTQLANGYCDAEEVGDEVKRSQYYSALMLRYWYKIYEWQKTCASMKLELEDFVTWIAESFDWAFRYRAWRKPYKYDYTKNEYRLDENGEKIPEPLYEDPNGPDKVFKRCLFSTRGRHYQESNKDCRRTNYMVDSIEAGQEILGDSYNTDAVEDDTKSKLAVQDLVRLFIEKKQLVEAVIIDKITESDCFDLIKNEKTIQIWNEETEEYEEDLCDTYEEKFNERKLVKDLKTIDSYYIANFINKYNLDESIGNELLSKLVGKNGTTLHRYIDKTMYTFRNSPMLLRALGCY